MAKQFKSRYEGNKVRLPSLGKGYDSVPLINGDSVAVHKYVQRTERIYLGAMKTRNTYKIYGALLDQLMSAPRLANYDAFLLTDVLTILYMVKIWSWGQFAEFAAKCYKCNIPNIVVVDMGALLVRYADEIPDYKDKNIEMILPTSQQKISIHLPTMGDEKVAQELILHESDAGRLMDEEEDESLIRLAQQVDTVDGVAKWSLIEKFNWLLDLPLEDVDAISATLNENATGLFLTQASKCAKCSTAMILDLEVGPDFFRPFRGRVESNVRESSEARHVSEHPALGNSGDDTTSVAEPVEDGIEDRSGGRAESTDTPASDEVAAPVKSAGTKSARSARISAIIEEANIDASSLAKEAIRSQK